MEINSVWTDTASALTTVSRSNNSFPPILQLPTEVLIAILQLALPEVNFASRLSAFPPRDYIEMLYIIRSVTKRWQDIIEGTPSFWTIILSTLPPHVIETSIRRSANLPLHVIYSDPEFATGAKHPSVLEFLDTIARARLRWSADASSIPTNISEYIGDPTPVLQMITARSSLPSGDAEPSEPPRGDTSHLRYVDLSDIPIHWKVGCLIRLKALSLNRVQSGLTGSQLLDILRASPGLQELELDYIKTDLPPPSPIITLNHLKYINLESCSINFVKFILQQIRVPSCTKLDMCIDDEEFDVHHLINETLRGIIFTIHKRFGESEVLVDSGEFSWYIPYNDCTDEGLSIHIEIDFFDPRLINWVHSVLQNEPGLRLNFGFGAISSETLENVAPMRCVTKVLTGIDRSSDDLIKILRLLGKPLKTNTSIPSLPLLRELRLDSMDWSGQALIDMVHSRFRALSWEGMERTLLTISIDHRLYSAVDLLVPRPILGLAALAEIREMDGVRCVKILDFRHPGGMLAVVWNEETSEPGWV